MIYSQLQLPTKSYHRIIHILHLKCVFTLPVESTTSTCVFAGKDKIL